MPIDFNNRNASDPNGVVAIKPSTNTAWVRTDANGAWQGTLVVSDTSPGPDFRKVSYATVTLNNGDMYRAIVDDKGQPISEIGDRYDVDQQQATRWGQTGPKPLPPGGTPTQRRQASDGQTHIYGYNPQTGQYDLDQGAVASGAKPPIPAGGSSATEGTPDPSKPGGWDNSRPRQVIKDAKGNPIWSEELTGSDLTAWRANQQANQPQTKREPIKDRPGYSTITTTQGGNTETHVEKDDAPGVAVTLPAVPGTPTLKPDGKGGTIAVQTMPDGSIKTTPLPGVPSDRPQPERVTVNGQVYERDPQSGQYSPARGLPTEGAATAGGPQMPEILLGHAEEALRTYWTALNNDPSLTPATRTQRFGEAERIAQTAVQEAATAQRERESQRNAETNQATARLTYFQSGMGQALDYASKLNATLDPGSDLGGKAFAAIMGLQLIQMGQSGINSISKPGTSAQPPAAPTLTARDLNDPTALAAKNAEIAAHAAQTAAQHEGQPLPANGQPRPGEPPARANVPAQPATPAPTAGEPGGPALQSGPVLSSPTTLPAGRPDQTQVGGEIDSAISPPSTYPTPPGVPDPSDPNIGHPGDPGYQPPTYGKPDYGAPMLPGGPTPGILPQPPDPSATPPLPPGEVSRTTPADPTGGFAVMKQFGAPLPPPAAPTPQTGGVPMDEPPAMRAARIKATVPWQLDNSDLEWAQANGLLDHALAVPGRAAA